MALTRTVPTVESRPRAKRARRRSGGRPSTLPLHLMLIPGVILTFVFSYIPMFGIIIAFQDYQPARGFLHSEWVGLENFHFAFSMPGTWQIVWNTVYISVLKIIAGLVVPIVVALLLNEAANKYFRRSAQTVIYLPHFLSWVILGGILIDILSPSGGLVNKFLGFLGIPSTYFLGSNSWFPLTLVISNTWKEFGFSTIVYLAALTSIGPSLYEAASVDGAGRLRQAWHITLPGMRPIIVLLSTLSLGNVLNAGFEQVFVLYSPQVYQSGDIIDTYVYRAGLVDFQYSYAASVGLMKGVISLVLISTAYYMAYRFARYRIF